MTLATKTPTTAEKFWDEIRKETAFGEAYLEMRTKDTPFKTELFNVCTGMKIDITLNGEQLDFQSKPVKAEKYVACEIEVEAKANEEVALYKYAVNLASLNHPVEQLVANAKAYTDVFSEKGFEQMKAEQTQAWADRWAQNDILIQGDDAAQQGIRFNIFQLEQTYTGEDARLNIGPKGFTGEKYGGSTYWDTEAYCLPFTLPLPTKK